MSEGAAARSEATFPLSVVMSNFCVSALELALVERSAEDEHPTAAIASAMVPMMTLMSLPDFDCGKNAGKGAIAPPAAAMFERRAALCQGVARRSRPPRRR